MANLSDAYSQPAGNPFEEGREYIRREQLAKPSIKERMEAQEKLESEEGIRHAKAVRALRETSNAIQAECKHPVIERIQYSPEAIDVCKDCGKMIL